MQKWFSALDDAIIQRQWQANPLGAWGGVGGAGEGCALHLGLDRNAALSAPRHGQAGRENSSREGRRTALAAGPQPAREEL